MNNIDKLIIKFEKDFRKYLHASIRFAEMQEPYRPLSAEDEIKWLKKWIRSNVK